jgi:hypothetical protein
MQTGSGLLPIARTTTARSSAALVMAVFITGLVTRLWGIGGSLWTDEFGTLWIVDAPLSEVASRVRTFPQTPLYYYVTWVARHALGESEIVLRLPSLVASLATAAACGWAARQMGNHAAGAIGFAFGWLLFPAVQAAVNARPYSLVLAAIAVGIAGYVNANRNGSRVGRALVSLALAVGFWTHFLLILPLIGLLAVHVATPPLETRYPRTHALIDGGIGVALCLPAWPWVNAALSRSPKVGWVTAPRHLDAFFLIAPLLLPWLLGQWSLAVARTRLRPLLGAILLTVAVLEVAQFGGPQLVTARYMWGIIVPAIVLAAVSASMLRGRDLIVALASFCAITASAHVKSLLSTGSPSGVGVEDWRSAAAALRQRVGASHLLVLHRSGFIEQDEEPLGSASPATLAAIRSPGEEQPPWHVIPLTYHWDRPARARYFSTVIAPAVASRLEFALLCQRAIESGGSYTDRVIAWVETTFPHMFTFERVGQARGVDVVLFRRTVQSTQASRAASPSARLIGRVHGAGRLSPSRNPLVRPCLPPHREVLARGRSQHVFHSTGARARAPYTSSGRHRRAEPLMVRRPAASRWDRPQDASEGRGHAPARP